MAFTCVMLQILSDFVSDAVGRLPTLLPSGTDKVPPITWVDDVTIFLEDDSSTALYDNVRQVVRIMAAKCRSYGLDINFTPGKSEVLFHFLGRDAAKLRTQIHEEKTVDLGEGCWGSLHIPVTSRYTHLGAIQQPIYPLMQSCSFD